MGGKASKYFSIEKYCGELFSVFGARFYSHYTQNKFFQIGAHLWFDKNWLGRHKRGLLRTHRTSYIKTNCCFCSFFTEKTIWILTLFNVRLSRFHEVKKIQNDWSSINFHYSGPHKSFDSLKKCHSSICEIKSKRKCLLPDTL